MCDREMRSTYYYVYLLLCDDGSYYTGYTNNVPSRLERHKKGYGARYTRMRRPKRVIRVEEFKTRRAAMRRERQIKALTHDQKRDLERKVANTRFKISHAKGTILCV
jgi:putative endonuclease